MSNLLLIIIIIIICYIILFNRCEENFEPSFTSAFETTDHSDDKFELCKQNCHPSNDRCLINCLRENNRI